MTLDPFAGRALARARPRCLAVNRDGVFYWPGIALVRRRGEIFQLLDQNRLNDLLGSFYGPDAIYRPVRAALEAAGSCLRRGDIVSAETCIEEAGLPPVSPNGWRLMRAIGKRQDLPLPDVPVAGQQRGSVWSDHDAAGIAKSYDQYADAAQRLGKLFRPGVDGCRQAVNFSSCCGNCGNVTASDAMPIAKANFNSSQPRVPRGQAGGGEWTADGAASASEPGFTTVQAIPFPFPETLPFPIPRILPPTEITPPAVDFPNINPREIPLENPFPEKRRCNGEWMAAHKFCQQQQRKKTFKPGYRGFGASYNKCLLGQVSEECGGNKTAKRPEA